MSETSPALLEALEFHDERVVPPLRHILIASDADVATDDAFVVAREIVEFTGADARVVSVCEPAASPAIGMIPRLDVDQFGVARDARFAALKWQLARTVGADVGWPLAVELGPIASTLAGAAQSCDAGLIITGRGRHSILARIFGESHIRRVVRRVHAPVLAVEPGLRILPRRAVIAIDFSEESIRAAALALRVLDPCAVVYLVHVIPEPPVDVPRPAKWAEETDDSLRAALERVRERLHIAETMPVEPVTLRGRHASVVLEEFAKAAHADLVVAGAQGLGALNRIVIGSVTSHLLRHAPCSVLCVPYEGSV